MTRSRRIFGERWRMRGSTSRSPRPRRPCPSRRSGWRRSPVGVLAGLVPDRMLQLRGDDLDILIYPMDILIAGTPPAVARARAAMASRLTTSAAHLTVSAEAQAIEDRLTVLAGTDAGPDHRPRFDEAAATEFAAIDARLATHQHPVRGMGGPVPPAPAGRAGPSCRRDGRRGRPWCGGAPGGSGPGEAIATVGRILRQGTSAILDAVTDDSTIDALDRLAGPRWRLAAQAADVAVVVARGAVEGAASPEHESSPRREPGWRASGIPDRDVGAPGDMAFEDDSTQS